MDSLPPRFSKSAHFNLTIANKKFFKRCLFVSIAVVVAVPAVILLLHFLLHKSQTVRDHNDLTLALKQALLFFDAQKSGILLHEKVDFRGNSSLNDGKDGDIDADLVGGFYDSGNNIKFNFSTAYTVTLLSWTVIEYQQKYEDIGELDHIKDIIKWGSDYFIGPNSTPDSATLYSQVGGKDENQENDISCRQRPEDMNYKRPVSVCDDTAADIAGEIVAGMSAASLVFAEDHKNYSQELVEAAELLFRLSIRQDESHKPGMYIDKPVCGGRAIDFYN